VNDGIRGRDFFGSLVSPMNDSQDGLRRKLRAVEDEVVEERQKRNEVELK
jgi:hypothetical protein